MDNISFNSTNTTLGIDEKECKDYLLVVGIIINSVLTVVAVLGNTLVVLGMWKERNKSAMSFLLIQLSVSNTVVALGFGTWPTLVSLSEYSGNMDIARAKPFMDMYYFIIVNSFFLTTTYIIVLMSVVRYLSVCKALDSLKWTSQSSLRRAIVIIYFASFLFNMARFFRGKVVWDDNSETYAIQYNQFGESVWFKIFYWTFLYCMVVFVIPTVIMIFTTAKLIYSLRKIKAKKAKMTSPMTSQPRSGMTISLIAMVITFIILNFANPFRRLIISIQGRESIACGNGYYYMEIVTTSHILNSSANFVCYILLSKPFRKKIFAVFNLTKNNPVRPDSIVSLHNMPSSVAFSSGPKKHRVFSRMMSRVQNTSTPDTIQMREILEST